jgi:hypothetical protein
MIQNYLFTQVPWRAQINTFYHMVLMAPIARLPEEAHKLLVEVPTHYILHSLWKDIQPHNVHGETIEA